MNTVARTKKTGTLAISLVLLVAFYYLAYRYPLQLGDPKTSPTYQATPLLFQLGKYALLAPLLAWATYQSRRNATSITRSEAVALGFAIVFLAQCAIVAFYDTAIAIRLFEVGFMILFVLTFASPRTFEAYSQRFITIFTVFFWLNIAAYAIQWALYKWAGRLPALAYESGSVRFGGMWDDPNSALAAFALYVPYRFAKKGITFETCSLAVMALIALILSQSGTSVVAGALAVLSALFLFGNKPSRSTVRNGAIFGFFGAVLVAFTLLAVIDTGALRIDRLFRNFDEFLRMKQGSIDMHANTYSLFGDMSFWSWIGFDPVMDGGENEFVNILVNFGLATLALFVVFHVMILSLLRIWTKGFVPVGQRPLAIGCACYFIWYFASMFNLPAAEVFPINLIGSVIAGLTIAAVRRGEEIQAMMVRSGMDRPAPAASQKPRNRMPARPVRRYARLAIVRR